MNAEEAYAQSKSRAESLAESRVPLIYKSIREATLGGKIGTEVSFFGGELVRDFVAKELIDNGYGVTDVKRRGLAWVMTVTWEPVRKVEWT